MKAQLCHTCCNCTTFCRTFLDCYAEIWVFPPRHDWAGEVQIVLVET
jgi:hypothetical protein